MFTLPLGGLILAHGYVRLTAAEDAGAIGDDGLMDG